MGVGLNRNETPRIAMAAPWKEEHSRYAGTTLKYPRAVTSCWKVK